MVFLLTTNDNIGKLTKSIITIIIYREINELAVKIEWFTHPLLSSLKRHLFSTYYLPCDKY